MEKNLLLKYGVMAFFIITITGMNATLFAQEQDAKKALKRGEKMLKDEVYEEAELNFTTALRYNSNLPEAYQGRALAREQQQKWEDALSDFKICIGLGLQEPVIYYKAANMLYHLDQLEEAQEKLTKSLGENSKYVDALVLSGMIAFEQNDLKASRKFWRRAVIRDKERNPYYIFYYALTCDSMQDYNEALKWYGIALKFYLSDVKKASVSDPSKHKEYGLWHFYMKLASVEDRLGKGKEAREHYLKALNVDPQDPLPLLHKGRLEIYEGQLLQAIVDFSLAIKTDKTFWQAFYARGTLKMGLGEYNDAISDFTKVAMLNTAHPNVYYYRGLCYVELDQREKAKKDLHAALLFKTQLPASQIKAIHKHLFELYRENEPPMIKLTKPSVASNNQLFIPMSLDKVRISGEVEDASLIRKIIINDSTIVFDSSSINPTFSKVFEIPLGGKVQIYAEDVYGNANSTIYNVKMHEADQPKIYINEPKATFDRQIYWQRGMNIMLLEGTISDESEVASITVDGKSAQYNMQETNPEFTININVEGKKNITVIAKDKFGNTAEEIYNIVYEKEADKNRTLVVFVENSDYKNFLSLSGPAEDYKMVKQAMNNYNATTIKKENMTKEELDKFFSMLLRDMVRESRINSLVIWYAGHGQNINGNAYWVPIDAKKDDEYSFYNIQNLKASLATYKNLDHILVVSDACETGNAFVLQSRDTRERSCDQLDVNARSAQALTSSGYDLAADNSIFTQKFTSALIENQNECLSVNQIMSIVIPSVQNAQKVNPTFGKINGLHDEGGTFMFYKR